MATQRKKIIDTVNLLKKQFPAGYKASLSLIIENNYKLSKTFKILKSINLNNNRKMLLAKCGDKNIIILKGRLHFFDGFSMRDISEIIYVLKYLGINKIISVDEAGQLNPRFNCGELALIFDHINFMGDNPLIGENDDELGVRFPDMSNAYSPELFLKAFNVFQNNKIKINESVLLGIIGPESETEAEARFYRYTGSDILSYSIVPENITAVHCGIKFLGIGLLSRELIADKMKDDTTSEKVKNALQQKNLKKANELLNKIILPLIKNL